jgi:predicted nucleic acid-binding protein
VAKAFLEAVESGQILGCPIVALELLYTARNAQEFDVLAGRHAGLREVPVTRSVTRAAIAALRELAHRRLGYHRVPPADALVAAAAQEAGVGVLHHDRHYDRLAEVLDFESRWIVPPAPA